MIYFVMVMLGGIFVEYYGNQELLKLPKTAFFCSRTIPAEEILRTYDWAREQRKNGRCIISGFHSTIEHDVLEILLKGTQPIIWVLARGLYKKWPEGIREAVEQNRMLVISAYDEKISRPDRDRCLERNQYVASHADEIYNITGTGLQKQYKR